MQSHHSGSRWPLTRIRYCGVSGILFSDTDVGPAFRAKLREAVEHGVVGVAAVGRGVEAEREQVFRARAQVRQREVAQADDLRGDVAEAMHAEQLRSSTRKITFSRPPCPAIAPRAVVASLQRPTT